MFFTCFFATPLVADCFLIILADAISPRFRLCSATCSVSAACDLLIYIYARNCDYVYNFMYAYPFENALYLLKLDFMFLKLDLRFLKLDLRFLKLVFIFLKLDFIFLNSGLKRCSLADKKLKHNFFLLPRP